jgi:hypothetical protein
VSEICLKLMTEMVIVKTQSVKTISEIPLEIIQLIMTYCVNSTRDLIRLGCVCQFWRRAVFNSPLWRQPKVKQFIFHFTCTWDQSYNEISPFLRPPEISKWYLTRLHKCLSRCEEIANFHAFLATICSLLVFIAVISFGISWSDYHTLFKMYHVGFLSLSVLIFLTPIYLSYLLKFKSTAPSPFIRYLLFVFCFHFTLIFSYLKLLVSSSFSSLWVITITPPCILILLEIMVTIKHECDRVTSRDTFLIKFGLGVLASLLFIVVFLPPFLSLYLYCFYLDYHSIFQHYPFDFSQCLFPLILHFLFCVTYILKSFIELFGVKSHHQLVEMILAAEEMMLTE